MFCHGPLQFWLSAPDDERSYLALMRHEHNPSLCRLTRHEDGAKTDTPDLLQWLLLREPQTTRAVTRRDTQRTASPLNYARPFNALPPNEPNSQCPLGWARTCHDWGVIACLSRFQTVSVHVIYMLIATRLEHVKLSGWRREGFSCQHMITVVEFIEKWVCICTLCP